MPNNIQKLTMMAAQFQLHGYAVARDTEGDDQQLGQDLLVFCLDQFDRPGNIRVTYDEVNYHPGSSGSIAYSLSEMTPHTDGTFREPPPSIVALKCLTPDQELSGVSILVDGYRLLGELTEHERWALLNTPLFFRNPASAELGIVAPMLKYRAGAPDLRFRFDSKYKPKSDSLDARKAIDKFAVLASQPKYRNEVWLQQYGVVIINNRRVMHGRSQLSGNVLRKLLRASFYERQS